ncbi:membrane-bound lytic murein transglycosylase A [Rhizobiales bacterium GAS191]|nr:membrane-bound lytic murein transglycosylase A [Rhizobiales bacterium GAS191]SED05569.1 membrane-bound lytic murein transglycosylase A [Rhizobiales bacterium GAS188]
MSPAERPTPPEASPPLPEPRAIPGARLQPLGFETLPGWGADDLLAAFRVFRTGAAHLLERGAELRPAGAPNAPLLATCRAALATEPRSTQEARAFFEANFAPAEILPLTEMPFFTGYFEPLAEGSIERRPGFEAPILARPADLVTLPQGDTLPDAEGPLTSARRVADNLLPYPDRAAIEDGALAGQGLELVWLKDRVEVFIIQVQGSARVGLTDGRTVRLRYAGRNGWPYTSIGRLLIEQGAISAGEMSLEALTSWLRDHPGEAQAVMRRNRSYVFFAIDEALGNEDGPIGGAGLPLTPGRSMAIDRGIWSYGLPFFIDLEKPLPGGGPDGRLGRWQRLMIAQDTGSAIVGPGRVDLFFGSGPAAGMLAGRQRHHGRLFVLQPRGSASTP